MDISIVTTMYYSAPYVEEFTPVFAKQPNK